MSGAKTDRRPLFTRTSSSWTDVAIDVVCVGILLADMAWQKWRAR